MEKLKSLVANKPGRIVRGLALSGACFALLSAGPAQAAMFNVDWSFTGTPIATTGGTSDGNTKTFESNDPTKTKVRVSAWADTGAGGTIQTGELRQWATGLGEYNRDEPDTNFDYTHTVDNYLDKDFALFRFDREINLDSVLLSMWSGNTGQTFKDSDITVWAGSVADDFGTQLDLTGKTFADLNTMFGPSVDNNMSGKNWEANGVTRSADLTGDSLFGNVVIVAASLTLTGYVDRFKIKALAGNFSTVQIPEPAALGIVILGLAGIGFIRRRRAA
jgi:PEP-CTERM motif